LLFETALPARNRWTRGVKLNLDLTPRFSFGQSQHQTRAEDIAGWKSS
jgi:hypothetical protein